MKKWHNNVLEILNYLENFWHFNYFKFMFILRPLPGHIMSPHATKVHLPRPVAFIRQGSWDHSRKGVIGGVFVLILAILNLGVFFGLDGFTNAEDESEFFSKLTKTVINSFGIISLFIGIWQIQNLDDQELADRTESEMRNLDISLLRFTSFFAYLYHAFTIITGVFNANVKNFPNRIHNINGIVATIQITLQIIFVFDLRRKVCANKDFNVRFFSIKYLMSRTSEFLQQQG